MKPKMPKKIKITRLTPQQNFINVEIEEEEDGLTIWIGNEDTAKEIILVDEKGDEHKLPIRGLSDEFPFWEISRDGSPDGDVLVIYGDGQKNKRCSRVWHDKNGNLKHHDITFWLSNLPFRLKEIRIR